MKKKNGAHTHVRTTVQLESAIFTSVVVYSRTIETKKLNSLKVVCKAASFRVN